MKSGSNLEAVLAAGHFAVTSECGPPRGADVEAVKKKAELLRGHADACNITDNQTSVVRMSSIAACSIIREMGLDAVMQMVCRDRNRIALQSDILGGYALGIKNVLCLSGDHQTFGDHKQAKNVFDIDSIQLVRMVKRMRDDGKFLGGDDLQGRPRMLVGAAANPFADPFAIRARRLKKKIDAGADFIQTQCIYNIPKFKEWMKQVVDMGLHERTAILAGVTPLKSYKMASYMATSVAGMDIPADVLERMKNVPKDKGAGAAEGIKIAIETIEQLKEIQGVRGVHLMAIEWEKAVKELVKGAGLHPRPVVEAHDVANGEVKDNG
jgi:methylenetetrahydrofolate reductase (NADPH)